MLDVIHKFSLSLPLSHAFLQITSFHLENNFCDQSIFIRVSESLHQSTYTQSISFPFLAFSKRLCPRWWGQCVSCNKLKKHFITNKWMPIHATCHNIGQTVFSSTSPPDKAVYRNQDWALSAGSTNDQRSHLFKSIYFPGSRCICVFNPFKESDGRFDIFFLLTNFELFQLLGGFNKSVPKHVRETHMMHYNHHNLIDMTFHGDAKILLAYSQHSWWPKGTLCGSWTLSLWAY